MSPITQYRRETRKEFLGQVEDPDTYGRIGTRVAVHGIQRAEYIGDEEIFSYREYLADVLVELKRMVEDRGDGCLKKGQVRAIPFSVSQKLAEVWPTDIDERPGNLDLAIARLRDQDYRLQIEDMRFVKLIFEVISNISTEIYQSRLRDNPALPVQ